MIAFIRKLLRYFAPVQALLIGFVLLALIQIGGLGYMTLITFFTFLLGRRLGITGFVDYLEIGDGVSIVELLAPQKLIGKTLGECGLRQRFGLTVIAVRRNHEVISNTGANFRILADDELMVLGRLEAAEKLDA